MPKPNPTNEQIEGLLRLMDDDDRMPLWAMILLVGAVFNTIWLACEQVQIERRLDALESTQPTRSVTHDTR